MDRIGDRSPVTSPHDALSASYHFFEYQPIRRCVHGRSAI